MSSTLKKISMLNTLTKFYNINYKQRSKRSKGTGAVSWNYSTKKAAKSKPASNHKDDVSYLGDEYTVTKVSDSGDDNDSDEED